MTALREPPKVGQGRRELIGAWTSAGIAILALVGIFMASDPGSGFGESWISFFAPTMFAASAVAAWMGLRARRDGEENGKWPAFVGFVIGGFFTLMLLAALVGHLFGFE